MAIAREYRTVEKTAWGPGPWQDEPDKAQWTDEATGLPCLAKRDPEMGFLCGYVGVPEGHPCFGRGYDDVDVAVHGGLTYADSYQEGDEAITICHAPEPGQSDHVWWLGFDCGHAYDLSPGLAALLPGGTALRSLQIYQGSDVYRTLAYVREQCVLLAGQLAIYGA